MKKKKIEKPLTLTALVNYTHKTLLPAIENRLRGFATKEDLKLFATKEDLKLFATKKEMKRDMNRIMNLLDKVLKNQEDWRQENQMQAFQNRRANDQLENHEKRIAKVELKLKIA